MDENLAEAVVEPVTERLLDVAALNSKGSGLVYLPSLQLCSKASASWQQTALLMSLVESDSSAIRMDLHLEMALDGRPAFMCILAARYRAFSRMGLNRSLGVLMLSSVGKGEAEPAVLVVPAEATDQVL